MNLPKLRSRDLLTVTDLSREEILELFSFTRWLKDETRQGRHNDLLFKKNLAMIFEKKSTRTRVSFETGMYQLGGNALFLGSDDIQLGRGETIGDTARVLSRYVDGIMIRTYSHSIITEVAENATIPVINGLTDEFHPCQALTDFFTISEYTADLSSVKLAYVGDGNNVATSLVLTAALLGSSISVASPRDYHPDPVVVETARDIARQTGGAIQVTDSIEEATRGAHFLYTDVWTSMGREEEEKKRVADLEPYRLTREIHSLAAKDCRVMHCLPAHRGEEIESDLLDSGHSVVFDQAENRLHVQKSILCALLGNK